MDRIEEKRLIEMGIPPLDEPFSGIGQERQANQAGTVACRFGPEAGLVAEGIDQPGLTVGLLEDVIDHPVFEPLPVASVCWA